MPVDMDAVEKGVKEIGEQVRTQNQVQFFLDEYTKRKNEIIRANEIQIRLLEEALKGAIEKIRNNHSDGLNYVDEDGKEITDTMIWEALLKMDSIAPLDETILLMERVAWLWQNNLKDYVLTVASGVLYLLETESGTVLLRLPGIKFEVDEGILSNLNDYELLIDDGKINLVEIKSKKIVHTFPGINQVVANIPVSRKPAGGARIIRGPKGSTGVIQEPIGDVEDNPFAKDK